VAEGAGSEDFFRGGMGVSGDDVLESIRGGRRRVQMAAANGRLSLDFKRVSGWFCRSEVCRAFWACIVIE
jgi:hypothetical protein